MSTYIIAEAGVNHNGSIKIAKKLIREAKNAGADAIKFQTFITEDLVTKSASLAEYQKNLKTDESTQELMLKKLELSFEDFSELKLYCEKIGIDFLSTAFDFKSIDFLANLGLKLWKIPSGEITNLPYLIKIAQKEKPIILSTGMSSLDEVEYALNVLINNGAGKITILHCTTDYPTKYSDVNLSAMITLRKKFKMNVGYSDHTKGIEVSIAATALGASVIEKHFTLDKSMQGPDHKSSIEPEEFNEMVESIRNINAALGNGLKKPTNSELINITFARKSIVAGKNIKKGALFTEKNLTVKRPGTGISPIKWFEILGKVAKSDISKDQFIEIFHF